ncbi:hypothetical protein F4778DRAFT_495487 [Xylariomycetidae sp. FL2044]|nr:hypothetical protein F4778DRAFT_495487 [Xylariomycetidae sp. FL2044]
MAGDAHTQSNPDDTQEGIPHPTTAHLHGSRQASPDDVTATTAEFLFRSLFRFGYRECLSLSTSIVFSNQTAFQMQISTDGNSNSNVVHTQHDDTPSTTPSLWSGMGPPSPPASVSGEEPRGSTPGTQPEESVVSGQMWSMESELDSGDENTSELDSGDEDTSELDSGDEDTSEQQHGQQQHYSQIHHQRHEESSIHRSMNKTNALIKALFKKRHGIDVGVNIVGSDRPRRETLWVISRDPGDDHDEGVGSMTADAAAAGRKRKMSVDGCGDMITSDKRRRVGKEEGKVNGGEEDEPGMTMSTMMEGLVFGG